MRGGAVAHGPHPRNFATKMNRKMRSLALRSALSSKWRSGDLVVVKNLYWDPPPHSTNKLDKMLKTKGWNDAIFLTAPRNPETPEIEGSYASKNVATNPIYSEIQIKEHENEIKNFLKSCLNLPRIELVKLHDLEETIKRNGVKSKEDEKKPGELHAYEILKRKKVVLDLGALEWLEEKLGGSLAHLESEDGDQIFGNEGENVDLGELGLGELGEIEDGLQEELSNEADEILERNGVESGKVEKVNI